MKASEIHLGREYAFQRTKWSAIERVRVVAKSQEREVTDEWGQKLGRRRKDGIIFDRLDADGNTLASGKETISRRIIRTWEEQKKIEKRHKEEQERKRREQELAKQKLIAENERIIRKIAESPVADMKIGRKRWYDDTDSKTIQERLEDNKESKSFELTINRDDLIKIAEAWKKEEE